MATVTLIDGSKVASDSDAWKWQSLSRAVLRMPTLDQRRAFVDGFEKRNGKQSADQLRELMKQLHNAGEKAGGARSTG